MEITVTIGPFAAHNRNSTGQYPSNQLHLIHSQSRLLESPCPAPAREQNLVELRGTALPEVGHAAYLSSAFTKPKAKNLGACSPNRWLPGGRSPGHQRGCSLQGSENKNQGAKRKPGGNTCSQNRERGEPWKSLDICISP